MTDVVGCNKSSFVDDPRFWGSNRVVSHPRELASEKPVEVDVCLGRAGPRGDAVPRVRQRLPGARVDWRPAASDRTWIRAKREAVDDALRAAGLGRVEFMLGVIDAEGRAHGIRNLHVAGSSVFPYECANPTPTVVALALRPAHIRRQLAS